MFTDNAQGIREDGIKVHWFVGLTERACLAYSGTALDRFLFVNLL